MTHSIIAPSAASIWGAPDGCRGYPLMAQLYPELEESEASREGTASHEIGAALISFKSRGQTPKAEEFVGGQASNGVVIDQDMYDGALLYADDVQDVMRSTGNFVPVVEERVLASRIHAEAWGTPDAWLFDGSKGVLYLWDYKYGHEIVDTFENWQLLVYLCGILERLEINGHQDQHIQVRLRVVQPRGYHRDGPVREWTFIACDARPYFNQLHAAAHEALSGNAKNRSGPHCKHCPARHACEAALTAGMRLFEAASKPMPMDPDALSLGVQQTIVTRAINQLEYLKTGYEAEIESRIRAGQNVPYWRTEQGVGRETWAVPTEQVIAMGRLMGVDLRQDKPITPKQAVSLGIDAEVIKGYSHKPSTGVKVVPDNGSHARKVFAK